MKGKIPNPLTVEGKYKAVRDAWTVVAANVVFDGVSLQEFKDEIEPSIAIRAEIDALQKRIEELIVARDEADKKTYPLCERIVRAVLGTSAFGPNSALYQLMGYKRKDDYATGNTRKHLLKEEPVKPVRGRGKRNSVANVVLQKVASSRNGSAVANGANGHYTEE